MPDNKDSNNPLGNIFKNVGMTVASAFVPGLARSLQVNKIRQQTVDANTRSIVLKALIQNPELALTKGFQGDIKRFLGTNALAGFIEAGQNIQAQRNIQQLQLAGLGGQTASGQDSQLASQNQFGEATGIVTPTGIGISQQGVQAPIRAGVNPGGRTQTSLSISPKGEVRRTVGPVTAETRRFNAQEKFREVFRAEKDRLVAQGVDETDASIEAAKRAQETPGTATPEAFRERANLGAGVIGRRAFEQAAGGAEAKLAVPQRASAAQQKVFAATGEVADNTRKIFKLFDDLKDRFGPFKGRKEKVIDVLGVGSPEVRRFRRLRGIVIDNIARARTGSAASGLEFGKIEKFLPDLEDTPENFIAGLQAFVAALQSTINTNQKVLEGQNVIVPDVKIPDELLKLVESQSPAAAQQPLQTDAQAEAEAAAFLNSIGVTPAAAGGTTPAGVAQ